MRFERILILILSFILFLFISCGDEEKQNVEVRECTSTEDCKNNTNEATVCSDDSKICIIPCTPNEKKCLLNKVVICKENGQTWEVIESCEESFTCNQETKSCVEN